MTPKDCIDLIKKMKTVDFGNIDEKNEFINQLEMPVKALIYGEKVMRKLRGMLLGGNYDGAENYLQKAILKSKYWPYSELSIRTMGKNVIFLNFLMLAVSIVFLILGGRKTRLAEESFNWPQTEGVILKSFYYEDEYEDDDGDVWIRWMLVIEYSYVAEGKYYRSNRFDFDKSRGFADSLKVKAICDSYPVNSKTTVYYNPNNHQVAVLKPGLRSRFHMNTTIGLFILGFTVLGMIISVAVVVHNIRDDYVNDDP